jgi:choline kinase
VSRLKKAIVLAAGTGSRMRPLTDQRPKCLLEVGGETLVQKQLRAFQACGIDDVVMVVGYQAARVRDVLGGRVRYLDNARFAQTNSLYSLWLAREELAPGALIINSDVLALGRLFAKLVQAPSASAILVELGHAFDAEDMKVELRGMQVLDFGKDLPPERSHAHNVGMAKFSEEDAGDLVECLDRLVRGGHENDWAPRAYREFAARRPLAAVTTDGLPWIEIDFPTDLDRARIEIDPAILALEAALAS